MHTACRQVLCPCCFLAVNAWATDRGGSRCRVKGRGEGRGGDMTKTRNGPDGQGCVGRRTGCVENKPVL